MFLREEDVSDTK
uniref:Uncharacterized protein n=1 Tax=Anguilla anguilla TaxID=7936 RepID=A0A0E9XHH8_ANGAN